MSPHGLPIDLLGSPVELDGTRDQSAESNRPEHCLAYIPFVVQGNCSVIAEEFCCEAKEYRHFTPEIDRSVLLWLNSSVVDLLVAPHEA